MRLVVDPARVRLWVKLALLAAVGVAVMHALHLVIGIRIATRSLADEQEGLGRRLARTVAMQAADPLLVGDTITLQEIVASAASDSESRVSYCFVARAGQVVASSFDGPTPPALVALRDDHDLSPTVVVDGSTRILDLAEPVLDAGLGVVRLGLDMRSLDDTRHRLAIELGLLALAMIGAGLAASFVAGRSIARPIGDLLQAADRFDPSTEVPAPAVPSGGGLEFSILAERFNRMMDRLRAAHAEQGRVRQKSVETERLAAMGSLVAGVAHEVNNPLAGLKNCVHRLSKPELSQSKRQEYLGLMEEGLGRIEDVVKGLLDFARPHAARLEPTPLAELAHGTAHLLEPQMKRVKITCRVIADAGDGGVLADRHKVGQALVNLLLNASYVTPNGGEIRLRLRQRDGLRGIAVEDDGPGIPKEIRDRILDPFFTTKPPGEGSGLGLSVTRTIVDAHGGELTFEFPERGGTVATVWLRALPSQAPRPRSP